MVPQPDEKRTQKSERAAPQAESAGRPPSLGKYRIQQRIGAGGMGAVFLALDTELNRSVALKILPRDKAQNPVLIKRFKAEAQSAAQLAHENVVTLYEAGEADGRLYLAMEYVEGVDVFNLVRLKGAVPVRRSVEIVKQVAKALQHAFRQGIVHRDIKPSNLLVRNDGTVKLADMGLARSLDESADTGITRAGTTVGTVDYMSPEQARDSKSADVRSDIYSLGCTWYHMLTGAAPYPVEGLTSKLRAHALTPPPDPRAKNPNVPEALVAVLHRMMAKAPRDRYQTPAELLEDLENTNLSRDDVTMDTLMALAFDAEDVLQEHSKPVGPTSSAGRPAVPGQASASPTGRRKSAQRMAAAQRRSRQTDGAIQSGTVPVRATNPPSTRNDASGAEFGLGGQSAGPAGPSGANVRTARQRVNRARSSGSLSSANADGNRASSSGAVPLPPIVHQPGRSPGRRRPDRFAWTPAVWGVLLGVVLLLMAWLFSVFFSSPTKSPVPRSERNPFAAQPDDTRSNRSTRAGGVLEVR